MNLAGVQASVATVDSRYVGWLTWEQRGNIVTAKPKFTLPDNAHRLILKVFRKLGGKFVRPGYYELVLEPVSSVSTKVAVDIKRAYEELMEETEE